MVEVGGGCREDGGVRVSVGGEVWWFGRRVGIGIGGGGVRARRCAAEWWGGGRAVVWELGVVFINSMEAAINDVCLSMREVSSPMMRIAKRA